ncbi:hypothetical protein LWI29_003623 [Acer saccharum]|uniref:Putative plant transposon protein domain-containing protein n=1 Tax=Acer saccharum TaxID=4024 RepID=A0AA39SJD3_ACESA|nr:hypothetical protein LWI29_003623 [Acer saccharum]
MLGMVNDSLVREFYHEYKHSTTNEDALMDVRGIFFRVNSENINKFLGLPIDIESDFLDVGYIENLNEMSRTLCDNNDFEWRKRAFISQRSFNATKLNKEKIKIVYALVTNKPINLGEVLIEHIEITTCSTRLDKKLALSGFNSHFCLAASVKKHEEDVLLSPLEKFSDKRMAFMSYKDKGRSCDNFRLFGESQDSSLVSSTTCLSEWAMQLKNEVEE